MADYAWQVKAVARFAKERIAAIVAACGTGKTRAGIKLAIEKGNPTIIIAPKNICRQWEDDIRTIAGKEQQVWRYDRVEETKKKQAYVDEFSEWIGAPSVEESYE